jgi:hypothetical protein
MEFYASPIVPQYTPWGGAIEALSQLYLMDHPFFYPSIEDGPYVSSPSSKGIS